MMKENNTATQLNQFILRPHFVQQQNWEERLEIMILWVTYIGEKYNNVKDSQY